jgi:hypothetical protein
MPSRTATASMRKRSILSALIASTTVLTAVAGAAERAGAHRYSPPRTAAGQPDLQGIWTSGTATPFELPQGFKPGEQLTPDQAAALEQRFEDFRTHRSIKPTEVGHDNEAFMDMEYKVLPTLQSSLVVVPAGGRLQLTPEAERRRDFNLNNYDSYESMSPWDRCITRGPGGLLPAGYNNGYQIVQTAKHVMIMAEMIHEARIIPTDGSPHPDSRVRSWAGDSRGHWEGETLVVDTTNFNDRGWFATHMQAGRLRGVPYTEELHVVERFTRTGPDTLHYEITVTDPTMYSSSWTASLPFERDDGYVIYEYACHEGNQATELILRGARVQEQQTAEASAADR